MTAEAWLGVMLVALGIGTLLSTLVQSLRDLSRSMLEEIGAIRNRPGARARIAKILDDQGGHAAAIALPRTLCNLVFAIATILWLTAWRGLESPDLLSLGLGAVGATFTLWVSGVVIPHSIARHAGEATVYSWSALVRVVYVAGRPFAALAQGIDDVVRRLSGRTEGEVGVQQELLSVVEDASVEGRVDETEKDMIEAVVRFRDKTVGQVMTPRTEIEAMELVNDLSAVTAAIRRIGHSRIPVYEESLDHVVGVFYVKDLMKWLAGESARSGKVFDLRTLCRPAYFVPETKTIRELLREMTAKRTHLAMVADEYGGTAGLVTIEDIIEEVFGDIADEYEEPAPAIPEVAIDAAARSAELDGRVYISDANDALRALDVELPESEDYDTVAGFVTVSLGHIPGAGEQFVREGITVTVLAAEPARVTRVKVEVSQPAAEDERERHVESGA
ncbi:MAG: hemolysin family protein [Planctomycetota bacterium]|nr:hemolysin family protein [Planctomycetota bacterium]